jgi:hypothetical protein
MSTDREATRIVRSWLEEGVTVLPDRVLDAVLDQVPTTPQRRSWWPAWRSATMNTYAKFAIAAAAVLVVAVVGYNFLPGRGGVGGPAATPSPTDVPRLPANGPIEAGTYRIGSGPTFLVTIPAGWVSNGGMSIRKNLDQPNEVALDLYRADIDVFADACESFGTEERVGPTAEDLLAALVAQENSDISDPVDVTVAGLPGSRFEVSAPAGLDLSQCSIGSLQVWKDAGEENYLAGVGHEGGAATAYVADTPGGRLLFVPGQEEATAADIAERDAIVASIQSVE